VSGNAVSAYGYLKPVVRYACDSTEYSRAGKNVVGRRVGDPVNRRCDGVVDRASLRIDRVCGNPEVAGVLFRHVTWKFRESGALRRARSTT